jgi:hypothetical protein
MTATLGMGILKGIPTPIVKRNVARRCTTVQSCICIA